jgi:hypothetical protein
VSGGIEVDLGRRRALGQQVAEVRVYRETFTVTIENDQIRRGDADFSCRFARLSQQPADRDQHRGLRIR